MENAQKTRYRKLRIATGIILLAAAILSGAFFWYVSDYYHAEDMALEVMAQDAGTTVRDNLTILSPSHPGDTAIIFYPGGQGGSGSLSASAEPDTSDGNYLYSGTYAVSHGDFRF